MLKMGKIDYNSQKEAKYGFFRQRSLISKRCSVTAQERWKHMKRRVLAYVLSAGSVYLTMSFLTKVFVDLVSNLTLSMI
jgi:hypothetical protein